MRQLPPVLPSLLRVLVFALAVMACGALTAATALPDLKPGQFTWAPEIAPSGPVTVVVSLPEQRAYVYRNGVRIGVSTVSSGRPGFDTPSGVYRPRPMASGNPTTNDPTTSPMMTPLPSPALGSTPPPMIMLRTLKTWVAALISV